MCDAIEDSTTRILWLRQFLDLPLLIPTSAHASATSSAVVSMLERECTYAESSATSGADAAMSAARVAGTHSRNVSLAVPIDASPISRIVCDPRARATVVPVCLTSSVPRSPASHRAAPRASASRDVTLGASSSFQAASSSAPACSAPITSFANVENFVSNCASVIGFSGDPIACSI